MILIVNIIWILVTSWQHNERLDDLDDSDDDPRLTVMVRECLGLSLNRLW